MILHAQEGSSMCARPICFSPLAVTPSHARALAVDSPGEDPLTDYTAPSFTQYKSPSHSLSSFILPPFTKTPSFSRTRSKRVFFESSVDAAIERKQKLDVLSHLPPEIAVKILCYLQPQDLCQVCRVCCRWYQLTQHPPLRKKRRKYIQACREEYTQSKENLPTRSSTTPQQVASHSAHRLRTAALSPLNVIQPRVGHHPNTPTSPLLLHTPGPAYLLEDVKKLSLGEEKGELEVRRQLFPDKMDSKTANLHYLHSSKHDLESLAGKKANKSRLRRL